MLTTLVFLIWKTLIVRIKCTFFWIWGLNCTEVFVFCYLKKILDEDKVLFRINFKVIHSNVTVPWLGYQNGSKTDTLKLAKHAAFSPKICATPNWYHVTPREKWTIFVLKAVKLRMSATLVQQNLAITMENVSILIISGKNSLKSLSINFF